MMKMHKALMQMVKEMDPVKHKVKSARMKGKKALCVTMRKASHGMSQHSLSFHERLRKDHVIHPPPLDVCHQRDETRP